MKKILFLLAVLLLTGIYSAGQKGTIASTAAMLEGKTWQMQLPKDMGIDGYNVYKNGKITSVLFYRGRQIKTEGNYYLSDTVSEAFYPAMVGKNVSGKYLISNSNSHPTQAKVHEIIRIDSKTLVLQYLTNDSIITFMAK